MRKLEEVADAIITDLYDLYDKGKDVPEYLILEVIHAHINDYFEELHPLAIMYMGCKGFSNKTRIVTLKPRGLLDIYMSVAKAFPIKQGL